MTALQVSNRGILELVAHEGVVLEAYKDSVGVWTWGIGITNNSGHEVYPRYKDNPQTLERVLEVYLWALQNYEADVDTRFRGYDLKEHERAAALSFHYNTGAILTASWPDIFLSGDIETARYDPSRGFMAWDNPPEVINRRTKEAELFFDAGWTGATHANVYPVSKPSYIPNWGGAVWTDMSVPLAQAMGDPTEPDEPDEPAHHHPPHIAEAFEESGADELRERLDGDLLAIYYKPKNGE